MYGNYRPQPLILIESYEEAVRALKTEPNAGYDLTGMMGSHSDLQVLEVLLTIAIRRTDQYANQIVFIPLDLERSVDLLEVYM